MSEEMFMEGYIDGVRGRARLFKICLTECRHTVCANSGNEVPLLESVRKNSTHAVIVNSVRSVEIVNK